MEGAKILQGGNITISASAFSLLTRDIAEGSVGVKGVRVLLVAWYHLVTTFLLTINFLLLSVLPEPPQMAPRRGVSRRWMRERFMQRCRTRQARLNIINHL